mmetsp:Transcript_18294/g.42342  ORF Transcript_18294/g.42342 Transcript_18294/m.42342 type:complete len:243 (+) Transcript_18294:84-812(+)
MPKKKQQKKVEAVNAIPVEQEEEDFKNDNDDNGDDDDEESEEEEEEEEEVELLQVDVGDIVKVKQILDETVASTILETTNDIEEDYRLDNFKLIIMTTACLFAMTAQFAPVPFPESRFILGTCCCIYFALSGVLQFITVFIDDDCILLTQKKADSENPNLQKYGIRVRSDFPRFSKFYSLRLQFQSMPDTPFVEDKWSVGKFFDVDGMFDEVGFMQAVQDVYDRFKEGKYDEEEEEDVKKKK